MATEFLPSVSYLANLRFAMVIENCFAIYRHVAKQRIEFLYLLFQLNNKTYKSI